MRGLHLDGFWNQPEDLDETLLFNIRQGGNVARRIQLRPRVGVPKLDPFATPPSDANDLGATRLPGATSAGLRKARKSFCNCGDKHKRHRQMIDITSFAFHVQRSLSARSSVPGDFHGELKLVRRAGRKHDRTFLGTVAGA